MVNDTEKARTAAAYRKIILKGGKTFVDGTEALGSNTVINAFINADNQVGNHRGSALVNAYERWGNYAAEGHRVSIVINSMLGGLTASVSSSSINAMLVKLESEGQMNIEAEEDMQIAEEKGEIQAPPDGKDGKGEGSTGWNALLELAKTIGTDLYLLIKKILTGEFTVVNTIGRVKMRAGDKLCVFLDMVDDQANIYIDDELIGARSLSEPGNWDYSDPLKPGKHIIMIVLENEGRFDYSMRAIIARASDYQAGGSRKPIVNMYRNGSDGLGAGKRVYYLKVDVA